MFWELFFKALAIIAVIGVGGYLISLLVRHGKPYQDDE